MNITLEELRKYVLDNYGVGPLKKKYDWQQDLLYYQIKDGEIELCLLNYWTDDEKDGQQFISFSIGWNNHNGMSRSCDSYDELKRYLDEYLEVKDIQLSLF